MSHLSTGRLNVSYIKELAKHELLDLLDKCVGTKAIVWDQKLVGVFGLVADYLLLKEHDVIQMFELRSGKLPEISAKHIIYITRPKLSFMDKIADNILKEDKKTLSNKDFHIIFVPRRSILCERKLQVLGVYGNFNIIGEYSVELFALDSDVLSMEWDSSFAETYLDKDYTSLFHSAKAIMTLQTLYGIIPNVYGLGKSAKIVFDLMTRMRKELASNEPQITPQIDQILLIDRSVDLLTPFLTQMTYEGLLDEIFGINHTTIKVPPEKFIQQNTRDGQPSEPVVETPTEPKQFHLNSSEELFVKLRDISFKAVGPTLRTSAKSLSQQFDERHNAKTVREIRQFVDKLPALQTARKSQSNHTSMAELIKEVTDREEFYEMIETEEEFINCIETDKSNVYIEDCIAREEPLVKVLRLICIQSFVNNGFKAKVLEFYKREILQTYGYNHLLTLNNLEKVGLIRLSGGYGNRNYNIWKKTLKLITDKTINEMNPTDITYVYNGYAPISVRLAQYLDHPGWRAIGDLLTTLPDPIIEEIQQIPVGLRKRRNSGSSTQSGIIEDQKVILVFFLGGCTFTEISALRFLSQKEGINADFVIATTHIINGKTFLQSLSEQPLK